MFVQIVNFLFDIKYIDVIDLYNLNIATACNHQLNFKLLQFFENCNFNSAINKLINLKKNPEKGPLYKQLTNWAIKVNKIFMNVTHTTLTRHFSQHNDFINVSSYGIVNDKITFTLFFDGLDNFVKYDTDAAYKNNVLTFCNIPFDIHCIDIICDDLMSGKETMNILKIHFPIISGIRHLQFLPEGNTIHIVDISNYINRIIKDLLHFKKILIQIAVHYRKDLDD